MTLFKKIKKYLNRKKKTKQKETVSEKTGKRKRSQIINSKRFRESKKEKN